MFLNIGLINGVLLRTVVDPVDGSLSDTRQRFLGAKPPKLARVTIHGSPSVLAFSSRSWLLYTYQDMLQTQPLIYDVLEYASTFNSRTCPEGLIAISGNSLRLVFFFCFFFFVSFPQDEKLNLKLIFNIESSLFLSLAKSLNKILHLYLILLENSSIILIIIFSI